VPRTGQVRRTQEPGMFTSRDCRRNLRWYLAFRIPFDFALWGPTWVLYMIHELGLSFTQIMLLDLFYQALIILLEIPTGMLADALGRRWSLRGAGVAMILSLAVWGFARNYWWVLGAWALWAAALALMNGADAALIYESLLADRREGEFGRVLGRFTTYSMLGIVVASLAGGWLAKWGYRAPIYAHIAVLSLTLIASLRLREPPRAEQVRPGTPREIFRSLVAIVGQSAPFRILLAYAAAVQAVETLVIIYQQPLLVGVGLSVERLGLFYAVVTLLAALGPVAMTWASGRWGMIPVLGIAASGIALSSMALYLLPGLTLIAPLVVVRFLADGARPVMIEAMNRLVGPRGRATVLSVRSMCVAAVVGPMEVLSGWWADRVPIRRIFIACGLALPLVVGCLGWLWRRRSEREESAELAPQQVALSSKRG